MTKFVMNNNVMKTFSNLLKNQRKNLQLKVRDVVKASHIDQALISKYENGQRLPAEKHMAALAEAYAIDPLTLKKAWLAEKIVSLVSYDLDIAMDAMIAAEDRVEYLRSEHKTFAVVELGQSLQQKLDRIDSLHILWKSHKPLKGTQLDKMEQYFSLQYTYESNRIEGNTLSLQETELVISKGITISGKSMTEHLEAINHADASSYLVDLVQDEVVFGERVLRELHSLVLRGIDKENAGVYRNVPVRISGSQHVPPQPYLLDKLMEDYFLYYQRHASQLHPVILAAEMHERLVSIHPFIDGNGRTSRLVMNLILLRHGFPIAILKGELNKRLAYYKALEAVQLDGDPKHFYHLIFDELIESLEAHLELAGVEDF